MLDQIPYILIKDPQNMIFGETKDKDFDIQNLKICPLK